MAVKSISIRIEDHMLNKLHVVADYEGPLGQQPNSYFDQKCDRGIRTKARKNRIEQRQGAGIILFFEKCTHFEYTRNIIHHFVLKIYSNCI